MTSFLSSLVLYIVCVWFLSIFNHKYFFSVRPFSGHWPATMLFLQLEVEQIAKEILTLWVPLLIMLTSVAGDSWGRERQELLEGELQLMENGLGRWDSQIQAKQNLFLVINPSLNTLLGVNPIKVKFGMSMSFVYECFYTVLNIFFKRSGICLDLLFGHCVLIICVQTFIYFEIWDLKNIYYFNINKRSHKCSINEAS